ncbi:MAG TPA: hypothetical protein VK821_05665 [Dehalococcoidia bacterium]|nr:hypothetical protein [Dehalococcoidia bacterium]
MGFITGANRQPAHMFALGVALATAWVLFARAASVTAAPPQQPAPLTAEVTLDKTRSTVGDPIGLIIVLRYDNGVQPNADGIIDQLAPFEAISADPPVDQRNAGGGGELRLHFRIAAYRTGQMALPALTFTYTAGGQPAAVKTQPIPFTVDSVIPPGDKAADIRPLKSQLDLPIPDPTALRRSIAAGLTTLLAAAIALVLWRTLRPNPLPMAPVEPVERSLEIRAHAELDRIVAQNYLRRGDYRTHYALIAECIRRYLTERYGFQASALTTTELPERMIRSGVGRWRARLVAGLLTECDSVHYAHYLPAPARAEADLQMAYEVVDLALSQETRPEDRLVEVGG